MFAEPILINAPEKEDRCPAWSKRADWSSNDALIAFWSAHPTELRDDFLNARAEFSTLYFQSQLVKHRAEQSALRQERRALIRTHAKIVPQVTVNQLYKLKRRKMREE